MNFFKIPTAKFDNLKVVIYDQNVNGSNNKNMKEKSLINLLDNKSKGDISDKSAKRLQSKLKLWYNAVQAHYAINLKLPYVKKSQFTLATLTLPSEQIHDDKTIKRQLLNGFITELKRQDGVENYIWKAEKAKNNRLHFHIVLDRYIHHNLLKNDWNMVVNRLGYVDRYQEKFPRQQPNSVDIRSLKEINNTAAYMAKYMAKQENEMKIEGKQYGNSDRLGKMIQPRIELTGRKYDEMNNLLTFVEKSKIYYDDFYTSLSLPNSVLFRTIAPTIAKEVDEVNLFNYSVVAGRAL